jgi:putative lipoic acid-binding regulatory protein
MNDRMLDLLKSQHDFPGPFSFKVIYRASAGMGATVVESVCHATGIPRPRDAPATRQSGGGRFESMTLTLRVESPEEVLAVYSILNGIEGVISAF